MKEEIALDVSEVFKIAQDLFGSDDPKKRNKAFLFFRDVWQLNHFWRAFHDQRNPKQEAIRVAKLLSLHRNTVTNKMQAWKLTIADFTESNSVTELIERSKTLRKTGRVLIKMRDVEYQTS